MFGRFGQLTQTLQTVVPVLLEETTKTVHLRVIRSIQATNAVTTFDNQFGLSQHADVLGDSRASDVAKLCGDLGCGELTGPDELENLPTTGFGEGLQCCVHSIMLASTYVSVN